MSIRLSRSRARVIGPRLTSSCAAAGEHLRATGIGASVAVGRTGAILGQIVLGELALNFGLWTAFGLLAIFWLIGATAGAIWWARGIEARGLTLEALAAQPQPS